jgi:hypothetical protein
LPRRFEDSATTTIAGFDAAHLANISQCGTSSMVRRFCLRELIDRGVPIAPHEAVAVAQQLIASVDGHDAALKALRDDCGNHATPIESLGPPTLSTVHVCADGEIVCHSAAPPAVFEMAMLLDAILKQGGPTPAAGGLRYAIARALMEVDAPPFESIAELSTVLARYERGDRRVVLSALYERGATSARDQRSPSAERRRGGPSVAALRRDLRDADRALFERQHVVAPASTDAVASNPVAAVTHMRDAVTPECVEISPTHDAVPDTATAAASVPAPLAIDFERFLHTSVSDAPFERETTAIRPRTALAAILLSMATGYAIVDGYRQVSASSEASSSIAASSANPAVKCGG